MNPSTESLLGRIVLLFGHVAGMLDLVILPLWVGGLMATHRLAPQEAGGIVTLFLIGVLVANGLLARRFGRLPNRAVVVSGYGLAALAFFALIHVPLGAASPLVELGALHAIAGLGIGAGLSCVHGTIARTVSPHRTFAIVNLGVGIFAVLFFALTPPFIEKIGVNAVFYAVLGLIVSAALLAALAFPTAPGAGPIGRTAKSSTISAAATPIAAMLAIGFAGVVLMQTAQAITNSFAERTGAAHGFAPAAIGAMFAVNGFISLFAPILAGLLEKKLPAASVAAVVLLIHGLCSIALTSSTNFYVYAVGFTSMIFVTIFGHTFIFGLFAKFDPTGRMNASTPSMLMLGTAIGPIVGGVVVQHAGFSAMGLTSAAVAFAGAGCFAAIARRLRASPLPAAA